MNEHEYTKLGPNLIVENNKTTEILKDLKSNTEYKVAVLLMSDDGNFNEEDLVYGLYRTSCNRKLKTNRKIVFI